MDVVVMCLAGTAFKAGQEQERTWSAEAPVARMASMRNARILVESCILDLRDAPKMGDDQATERRTRCKGREEGGRSWSSGVRRAGHQNPPPLRLLRRISGYLMT